MGKSNKEKKKSAKKEEQKKKSKRTDKKSGGEHKSNDKKKHAEKSPKQQHKKAEEKSKKADKLKHKEKKSNKESKKPHKKEKQKKTHIEEEEEPVESAEEAPQEEEEVEVTPPKKGKEKGRKKAHDKPKKIAVEEGEEAEEEEEVLDKSIVVSDEGSSASAVEEPADQVDSQEAEDQVQSVVSEAEQVESEPPKKHKHKEKEKEKKKHKEEKEKSTKKEPPKLEFTKPTINQMVREEERKKHPKPPLGKSEKIERKEFEAFNDEVDELNQGVQMLHMSYGSIIKSLVAMYTKRTKKGEVKPPPTVDGKVNFLTYADDENVAEERSCLEWTDKYDMERFINPATREAAFKALFAEVNKLNKKTEKLRTKFYDKKGYFLKEKYEAQNELKVSRKQLNEWWLWTRKLTGIIDEIARNYNDDLLNMFRLH